MKQKYYASRARRPFDEAELEDLLKTARRNNSQLGLTGLLVFGGDTFLQVVEGPDDAVDGMFHRICADQRHELIIQSSRRVDACSFPEWQMGFRRLDDAQMRALPGWTEVFSSDFAVESLPALDPVFLRLLAEIRRAAVIAPPVCA